MLNVIGYFEVAVECVEPLLSPKLYRIFGRQKNLNKVFNGYATASVV